MKISSTILCVSFSIILLQGCVTIPKSQLQEDQVKVADTSETPVTAPSQEEDQTAAELAVEVLRDVFVPIVIALITRG